MELIYEAFKEYKNNGFVNLDLVILIKEEYDNFDIYKFIKKEKENKELMDFWRKFNIIYCDNKNVIVFDECCICYEEEVGISTYCKHFGCFKCFDKVCGDKIVINCPYCRREVSFGNYVDILDDVRMEENEIEDVEMIDVERYIEEELRDVDIDENIEMEEVDRYVDEVLRIDDINEQLRLGSNNRMFGVLDRMRESMGEDDRYDDIFNSLEFRFRN